ncbi:MAG TPA: sigma-54 dependent transcriptional regulator [Gemmatimonadales bacterium]|nr:sigma-54 dependent transcriptional regulator [Gemmatimonadales bacterium]
MRGNGNGDWGIIGESRAIRETRAIIARVGPTDLPVLIEGATGVGKELVARALHAASRRPGAFVAFNVCAIPEGTFEAELFGHVKGAFTGATHDRLGYLAEANFGTAFLDEIGSLPPGLQPKLLRAVELREFRPVGAGKDRRSDFRVVGATNQSLEMLVHRREFRADLFHRLRGVTLHIPPLAQRREDIPCLARHFASRAVPGGAARLTTEAIAELQARDWPGNVRALRHVIEIALVLFPGSPLGAAEVRAAVAGGEGPHDNGEPADGLPHRVLATLSEVGWNVTIAAQRLGVHRATVHRWIRLFGLARPAYVAAQGVARCCATSHGLAATPTAHDRSTRP